MRGMWEWRLQTKQLGYLFLSRCWQTAWYWSQRIPLTLPLQNKGNNRAIVTSCRVHYRCFITWRQKNHVALASTSTAAVYGRARHWDIHSGLVTLEKHFIHVALYCTICNNVAGNELLYNSFLSYVTITCQWCHPGKTHFHLAQAHFYKDCSRQDCWVIIIIQPCSVYSVQMQ